MSRRARLLLPLAAVICFLPNPAFAQFGNVMGVVRDVSGGALPGVTVEVTSPALIEKVRSTTTDSNGRYQIVNLPVGTYRVSFKLESFSTYERDNIELSSDFTAPVNAEMKVGGLKETVTVKGEAPTVDVQNARQRQVFTAAEIRDLPTDRNLNGLLNLVPGISLGASGGFFSANSLNSVPTICSGGVANSDGDPGIFGSSTSGGRSGCSPVTQSFNAHSSMYDFDGLSQSRVQVDGLSIQGATGSSSTFLVVDVANASEVTFSLSGALGESETGGTTINIVPRTGGNRYSGQFFTSYSQGGFFGKNNESRPSSFINRLESDYNMNGAFGGPIVKDRAWFYAVMRQQGRSNLINNAFYNVNQGVFGANYSGDPTRPVLQDELYRGANVRLTLQPTTRDKFNLFWDEQYTCNNPCEGTSGSTVSPEASATQVSYPIHLAQLTWTNPLTNQFLLDAAVSWNSSHLDWTRNRFLPSYPNIPRVVETGNTTPQGIGITSGSINDAFYNNNDQIQSRASASYITGSHNVKLGYQGTFIAQIQRPNYNDVRMQYYYASPATTCVPSPTQVTNWCGLNPFNPNDPLNTYRAPVPASVAQYIPQSLNQRVWFNAFYLQDQWTAGRFTLNGAVRYDHSESRFPKTCVGPDLWMPDRTWCVNDPELGDGNGVNLQDITPRWGLAWDLFGNGKTALKWNMGKYIGGAGISGTYVASNPASRTVDTYRRTWIDANGDRKVDCDLSMFAPLSPTDPNSYVSNGECGARVDDPADIFDNDNTARRFGRSPDELDENGQVIGLGTTQCGRTDSTRIPQAALDYCAAYGDTLLDGWNKRRTEWQLGIGIQHELLPRLSMEITYNRRWYDNLTITDTVGAGCDLYLTGDADACIDRLLNYQSDYYDFYGVRAPVDPRLPGGGGYLMRGFPDRKPTVTQVTSSTQVQTISRGRIHDVWQGIDTNFNLRARGGLRISGGTSTGARFYNNCRAQVDNPPSVNTVLGGPETVCDRDRPYQTNVRGSATYTIPWVDVLVSTVFTYRPGTQINANYQYNLSDLVWLDGSEYRTGNTTGCPATNPGCLTSNTAATTVTQNLLGSQVANDTYGEGIRIVDLKFAKNIRFQRKRVNFGVDVYNLFNSDAALGYCGTYPTCAATGTQPVRQWRQVTGITTPRFVRFQAQFDF